MFDCEYVRVFWVVVVGVWHSDRGSQSKADKASLGSLMLLLCPPKLRIWPTPSCPMNRDEISLMRPFRTCQRRKQCVSFCEPPPSPPPAGAEAGSPRTDTNRLRWQSICKGGEGGPTYNTNPSQDVIKTWGELGPTNLHINKLYGRECGHSCDDQTPPSLKRSTVTSLLKSRLHKTAILINETGFWQEHRGGNDAFKVHICNFPCVHYSLIQWQSMHDW